MLIQSRLDYCQAYPAGTEAAANLRQVEAPVRQCPVVVHARVSVRGTGMIAVRRPLERPYGVPDWVSHARCWCTRWTVCCPQRRRNTGHAVSAAPDNPQAVVYEGASSGACAAAFLQLALAVLMATSDHDGPVAAAAVATAAAVTGALMAAVTTPLPVGPQPGPPADGPTKPIAEIELTLFLDDVGGVRVEQSGLRKDASASVGASRAARPNAALRRRRGAALQPAGAVPTSNGGQARAGGAATPRAPVAPGVTAAATLLHSTNPGAACQQMPLSSCTTANLYCDPPVLPMPMPAAKQSTAAQPPAGPGDGSTTATRAGAGGTGTGETAEDADANLQGDGIVMHILLPSETLAAALGLQAHAGPGDRGGGSSSSQGALGGAPDTTGGRLVIVADVDYHGVSLSTDCNTGSGSGGGSGRSGSGSSAGGSNARSGKGNTQLTLSPFAVDLPAGRVSVRLPAATVLGPATNAAGLTDRSAAAGLGLQTSSPASCVGDERARESVAGSPGSNARPASLRGGGDSPGRDASLCCDSAAGTHPGPTAGSCCPATAPASAARRCRRVWLHLMGVRRQVKEQGGRKSGEAASGGNGRAPAGTANAVGASSTTAAGALSGVALDWLGFTEVLLVPAAAAYELQDAWQDMVSWVRTHGEAGDAGCSPTQQAAAGAAGRESALGATEEEEGEPAEADGPLGGGRCSCAALPRFSRAAAHTHGHHMAALVRDLGTLLLGPRSLADLLGPVGAAAGAGAERGGGLQGSDGPLLSAVEAARGAIEQEVLAWLRTSRLQACLRLVTGLDGEAEEHQETGSAAAAAVEGAQEGQSEEGEAAALGGSGSDLEDVLVGQGQGGTAYGVHTGACSGAGCMEESSGSCCSPTCSHSCYGCPPSSGSSCSDTMGVLEQMLMLPYLATPRSAAATAAAAPASPQAITGEGSCPGGSRAGSFSRTPLELTRQLLSLAPATWPLSPPQGAHPASSGSQAAVSPAAAGPSRPACAGSSGVAGDPARHGGERVFAAGAATPARAPAARHEPGQLMLSAAHYGFPDRAIEAAYQRWRLEMAVGAGTGSSGNASPCGVPLPIAASCLVGALGLAACTWRLQGLGVTDRPLIKALAGMLWYLAPTMVQAVRFQIIMRAREARKGAGGKSAAGRCGAVVRPAAAAVAVGSARAGCSNNGSGKEGGSGFGEAEAGETNEDGVDNGHWSSSLVLCDTLVAASTGLLASLLGMLTYTCSRPCLHLKQDSLGCVLFVVLLRGIFAPLTQQLLPAQQMLVCVGMWAVDLVHVWVVWGGAAPTWVLVLVVVLVAYVNMVVSGFLDVRSRREFLRLQAGRQL